MFLMALSGVKKERGVGSRMPSLPRSRPASRKIRPAPEPDGSGAESGEDTGLAAAANRRVSNIPNTQFNGVQERYVQRHDGNGGGASGSRRLVMHERRGVHTQIQVGSEPAEPPNVPFPDAPPLPQRAQRGR